METDFKSIKTTELISKLAELKSKFRHRVGNVFVYDEFGFDRMCIVTHDIPEKDRDKDVMIGTDDGFCPSGLRYIYDFFHIDFIFDTATSATIFGTKCNHNKEILVT